MAAPICTAKTVLFTQVQDMLNQVGVTVVGVKGSVDTANATFNKDATTHDRRMEMLLALILEVLVDIREGSKNAT